MTENEGEEFRFERKFIARGMERESVESAIRMHPACFRDHHAPRTINTVYFDDAEFSFFKDNVEGQSERQKVRVRWYGDGDDGLAASVMEIKSKINQTGSKQRYSIEDFDLAALSISSRVDEWLEGCSRHPRLMTKYGSLRPVMTNKYRRSYFVSFDGKFRVTVDDQLQFFHPGVSNLRSYGNVWEEKTSVIELKYNLDDDNQARNITNSLPFRLSKMSKYVAGVYHLHLT